MDHPPISVQKRKTRKRLQSRVEPFNREKLHQSIAIACISSGAPTGQAEAIAKKVTSEVMIWLEKRPEVTSADLRRIAAQRLKTHHPDASYLYENHRSIL